MVSVPPLSMRGERAKSWSDDYDDSRRYPNTYPTVFPISLTHSEWPSNGS